MAKVDDIIEGLQIMKKYGEVDVHAEHDEFSADPAGGVGNLEDVKRLEVLGWHYDKRMMTWEIFT